MAGTSSAHLFETTSVNRESGKFARNALMAGVVRIKSPTVWLEEENLHCLAKRSPCRPEAPVKLLFLESA
jgi:hypothetical protein